jgi:hypothetical protein
MSTPSPSHSISSVTGLRTSDQRSTKRHQDDDKIDVRPVKAIKMSPLIPQEEGAVTTIPSDTVMYDAKGSTSSDEEHSRQEAALALLQFSNSAFASDSSSSYTGVPLYKNSYDIDEDSFNAAVSLMVLNRTAIQAQHAQPKGIVQGTMPVAVHNRMDWLTRPENDTTSENNLSAPEEEEVRFPSCDQEEQLTNLPVFTPEALASLPQLLNLDNGVCMPSASNGFKFEYDSPSGRTAAELNALLRPSARMKKWPLDASSVHALPLSYNQLGTMPKPSLANKLVKQIEKAHQKDVKTWQYDFGRVEK